MHAVRKMYHRLSGCKTYLRAVLVAGSLCYHAAAADGPEGGPKDRAEKATTVDLLFASSRQVADGHDPSRFLGSEQGPLIFGRCVVRYAGSPRAGRWSGYGDFLLPGDDRTVVEAGTLGRDAFVDGLSDDDSRRVVLFVHGYAYDFGRGCRRVSDLQVVLGESVRVVLFSWPSAGNPLRYEGDRQALRASIPALIRTTRLLMDIVGASQLVIAAHSMGALGVMEALRGFDGAAREKVAADLVFIAPDVSVDAFSERFPALRDRFGRVTVYTSANDALLALSSLINGERRLGQGGHDALVLPGLQTVDVSKVPRHHPAAHEYQYYNPHVVADLVELLRDGKGAEQRSGTTTCRQSEARYWVLRKRESEEREESTRSADVCDRAGA